MSIRHFKDAHAVWSIPAAPGVGHDHFWERAMSRRAMLGSAAGALGAIAAGSAFRPAFAGGEDPRPIPGGLAAGGQGYHVYLPGEGAEPSTITDFKGVVAIQQVQGTGMGRQAQGGNVRFHMTGRLCGGGRPRQSDPRQQPGYQPERPVLDRPGSGYESAL